MRDCALLDVQCDQLSKRALSLDLPLPVEGSPNYFIL